jgi:tungstate transport system substrate-binding protein
MIQVFLGLVATVALAASAGAQRGAAGTVILSTTTSTQDSGLLDVLVPAFERQSGHTVKTISVGTGHALALAARGEADVTLAHAPALEQEHVTAGKMLNRRLVMYNDFVLVGSDGDPAGIRGDKRAASALRKVAVAGARFVSRGDKSGTHVLEQALWREAGVTPAAPWYVESGQGMGPTLTLADERRAYTLTDRATLLAFARRSSLVVMVEGDRRLLNVYAVMEVNPANGPRVNAAGGKAFADFMVAPAAQDIIRTFGAATYGRALFVPIAGKRDEDL